VRKKDPDRILGDIGRRVAEIRREHSWTQAQCAELLGVSVNYVKSVEAGAENLTIRSLVRWAELLGVELEDLLSPPRSRAARRPGRPRKLA
jgi:transcriptional regulator with XRE-family HTH domain